MNNPSQGESKETSIIPLLSDQTADLVKIN